MKRKVLSFALALSVIVNIVLLPFAAEASSFEQSLKKKGFPSSYISALVKLHKKYPKWDFEVFNTGLDWSDAVSGERASHRNQIIEKSSVYGDKYYCNCANCKPNGNYVWQYSSCVSASKWAVEYFMDPRNWLDEEHIFQFQSNAYSSSDTQAGVEAILGSSFMHNADIVYTDTSGNEKTYYTKKGNKLKYSKGIMLAAKNSGMSAYYIASRIVKEVGGYRPSATGVCGTRKPFIGMYNFYSIGAGSGAMGGLEYASGYLRTEQKTTLYSTYNKKTKKAGGKTKKLSAYQYMSFIASVGNYYKVRLYSQGSYSSGDVGYVLKSAVRTSYFTYGRPWTNPYKCIKGGAEFIASSYLKYQYTAYLEKFNVNSASGYLYSHEYMQNVNAVSLQAESIYDAYKEAGVLSSKHTFYIPVFKNMPGDTSGGGSGSSGGGQLPTTTETTTKPATTTTTASKPSKPKLTARNTYSISFKWNKVSGASKYYVYVDNLTKGTNFDKTVTTNSTSISNLTASNKYKIRVKAYAGGKWTSYSKALVAKAVPMRAKMKSLKAESGGDIISTWKAVDGATGYELKYARDKKFKNTVAYKVFDYKLTSYTGRNFTNGVTYYIKVRAFTLEDSQKHYGKWSKTKTVVGK